MTKNEYIKQRTRELYLSLPQNKEERLKCTKVRDELLELNYTFFGYIASHTFVNNTSVSYEDKFQSACMHFCNIWWQYLWQGDETHRGYRQDIAFSVFFKPRISEMIGRELNTVKYSIRRSLCIEVGNQIGKHWGKVTYDDLFDPRVHLSAEKMASLKAIFGTFYQEDVEDYLTFIESPNKNNDADHLIKEDFDTIEELLIQEMITTEEKLTESKLAQMSEIYQIKLRVLKEKLPIAEQMLYKRLKDRIDLRDSFETAM